MYSTICLTHLQFKYGLVFNAHNIQTQKVFIPQISNKILTFPLNDHFILFNVIIKHTLRKIGVTVCECLEDTQSSKLGGHFCCCSGNWSVPGMEPGSPTCRATFQFFGLFLKCINNFSTSALIYLEVSS